MRARASVGRPGASAHATYRRRRSGPLDPKPALAHRGGPDRRPADLPGRPSAGWPGRAGDRGLPGPVAAVPRLGCHPGLAARGQRGTPHRPPPRPSGAPRLGGPARPGHPRLAGQHRFTWPSAPAAWWSSTRTCFPLARRLDRFGLGDTPPIPGEHEGTVAFADMQSRSAVLQALDEPVPEPQRSPPEAGQLRGPRPGLPWRRDAAPWPAGPPGLGGVQGAPRPAGSGRPGHPGRGRPAAGF